MNPMLTKDLVAKIAAGVVVAGSSIDDNSDIIDTAGYEGVAFIQPISDSVATGVATLTVEQNSANSDTGMAALAGAVATATCSVDDDLNDKALIVDVYRPRERYVQAVRTSATASIAFGQMVAILYGSRKLPITEDSSVADSAAVRSPAES
jgi:hypothetical protein